MAGFIFRNKIHCFAKENVSAITFELLWLTIVVISVVNIIIALVVRCLADTSSSKINRFLDAFILRPGRGIVAQVLLAEHSCGITIFSENLRHLHDLSRQN